MRIVVTKKQRAILEFLNSEERMVDPHEIAEDLHKRMYFEKYDLDEKQYRAGLQETLRRLYKIGWIARLIKPEFIREKKKKNPSWNSLYYKWKISAMGKQVLEQTIRKNK